jgi:glycosyltransferase involved in cell wall biosynthesis
VPFCLWLRSRQADGFWVMFHEVAFPIVRGQKLTHRIVAWVQRRMASIAAKSAARVWMSIPAWEPTLRELVPNLGPTTWLPVPSNMPTEPRPAASAAIREQLGFEPGDLVVGHFGTYGELVATLLATMLPTVLRKEARLGLLVGRGAEAFAVRLQAAHPHLAGRLRVAADLDARGVADHLGASDVLLQPYPDGVSSRRTSMMTGLALGIPTVTTFGALSEPIWADEGLVLLAAAGDVAGHVALVERLLENPAERRALGERASRGYARSFSVSRVIGQLRAAAETDARLTEPCRSLSESTWTRLEGNGK